MDHDGPGTKGVVILHFFEELEHANRGEGHPEIWPAGEVELGHKPLRLLPGHVSHLRHNQTRSKTRPQRTDSSRFHIQVTENCQRIQSDLLFLQVVSATCSLAFDSFGANRRVNKTVQLGDYLLDAELADGVVHQNHCVLYRHADVPVCPAALVRPVLGTFALQHKEGFSIKNNSQLPFVPCVDPKRQRIHIRPTNRLTLLHLTEDAKVHCLTIYT